MAAEKMAAEPDAFARNFIPKSKKVLHATRMLQPREIERLQFTAPNKPGEYPYVCTFPGHWRTMFGTLHVVPKLADVPYAPDEDRIAEFLVLMPEVGTQSFFHGIERVEPGHVATVTATSLVARRHWQPRRREINLRRPDDYSEALREHLEREA